MNRRRNSPARGARAGRATRAGMGGLVLTRQRRAILEAIAHRDDHPTAAGIFALVSARHPGTSRATVYRTLEKLAALGIIRKVCHPGAVVRYDPRPERHHHLLCRLCGAMIDVEAPGIQVTALPAKPVQGFVIEDYAIEFRGVCGVCRRGNRRTRAAGTGRKA